MILVLMSLMNLLLLKIQTKRFKHPMIQVKRINQKTLKKINKKYNKITILKYTMKSQ